MTGYNKIYGNREYTLMKAVVLAGGFEARISEESRLKSKGVGVAPTKQEC